MPSALRSGGLPAHRLSSSLELKQKKSATGTNLPSSPEMLILRQNLEETRKKNESLQEQLTQLRWLMEEKLREQREDAQRREEEARRREEAAKADNEKLRVEQQETRTTLIAISAQLRDLQQKNQMKRQQQHQPPQQPGPSTSAVSLRNVEVQAQPEEDIDHSSFVEVVRRKPRGINSGKSSSQQRE